MPGDDATRFKPPAPLAYVTVRNRDTNVVQINVPMLLDTGADITLIPQAVADQLGVAIDPDRGYEVVGFDGNPSIARIAELDLIFLSRRFHGQFLLIDQEYGVLGRNILNAVPLSLDGPHLTWGELRRG